MTDPWLDKDKDKGWRAGLRIQVQSLCLWVMRTWFGQLSSKKNKVKKAKAKKVKKAKAKKAKKDKVKKAKVKKAKKVKSQYQ